jgi:hypothetical protein
VNVDPEHVAEFDEGDQLLRRTGRHDHASRAELGYRHQGGGRRRPRSEHPHRGDPLHTRVTQSLGDPEDVGVEAEQSRSAAMLLEEHGVRRAGQFGEGVGHVE